MKEQADQAHRYGKFAEQLREVAHEMREAARRDVLLTMADDYELMAAQSAHEASTPRADATALPASD